MHRAERSGYSRQLSLLWRRDVSFKSRLVPSRRNERSQTVHRAMPRVRKFVRGGWTDEQRVLKAGQSGKHPPVARKIRAMLRLNLPKLSLIGTVARKFRKHRLD
jgi:hypothetical protein